MEEGSHVGQSCRWISQSRHAGSETGLAIDPKHVLVFPKANGRVPDVAESTSTNHNTHKWHFLYIYLQNVIKSSVQCLTNKARQILHASLALLFPPWCLLNCGRWSIQKNLGGWGEDWGGVDGGTGLQKNNQWSFCVLSSIIDFHMQAYKTMTRRVRSVNIVSNISCIHLSQLFFFTVILFF